jgi:hypothetical protein
MLYTRLGGVCTVEYLGLEWPGSGFPRSSVIYVRLPARSPQMADPYKQQEAPHSWNISHGSYSPPL